MLMRLTLLSAMTCLLLAPVLRAQEPMESSLSVGGASITIRFSESIPETFRKLVEEWIHDAADAVITVYGRYPVKQVTIEVRVGKGGGVGGGMTWNGRLIKVRVGSDATRASLHSDWVMTHEMFHLGFPNTEDDSTGWARVYRPTWSRWPGLAPGTSARKRCGAA